MKKYILIPLFLFLLFSKFWGQSKIETILDKIIPKKETNFYYSIFQRNDSILIVKTNKNVDFTPKFLIENKCYEYKNKVFFVFEEYKFVNKISLPFHKMIDCPNKIYNSRLNYKIQGYIYKIKNIGAKKRLLLLYNGNLNHFFEKPEYNIKKEIIPEPSIENVPKVKQ